MTDRHDPAPGDPQEGGLGYDALLAGHSASADPVHDEHDEHDGHDAGEGGDGAHAARRDPNRRRRWVVLGVAMAVVLGGLLLAFTMLTPLIGGLFEDKDYDGPGSGSASIVVHEGDTGRVIGQTLESAGIVKTSEAFEKALTEQPGDEIQPGSYALAQQMKASDAVTAMRSGKARDEKTVVLREGLRAQEIYEALSKGTGVPLKDYQAAAKNPKALGLPAAAKGSMEGYLFPATYTFGPKAGAAEQLKELVSQATARYSAIGVEAAQMHDIITIASIVEAEARIPTDRPKVAAVIENRLKINMPLQLDSTVSYGVGKRTITTTDAERADDNPYNTYLHPGLPKGPITNPGADAVQAALHPAKGSWLYFVAINPETGETLFANTAAEHNANVAKFQAWCQANPGKC